MSPAAAKNVFSMMQGRKSNDWVGVDFSGGYVKIVHARDAGGKMVIQNVFSRKNAEGSDVVATQFLIEIFTQLKLNTDRVVCVIPSKQFISKNVDIPSTEKEEISKIIDLQAGRFTPYSRDEIVIDYLCMETPRQHYTSVLLIIVNRKVVEKYCTIFETAGLGLAKISIASEGMSMSYDKMAFVDQSQSALAGIHIAEDFSDLTVLDQHQMVFVRNIPVGAENLRTSKETALADFLNELNKSLSAYQDQGIGRPIKYIAVTGLVDGLDFLEEAIRTSPAVVQIQDAMVSLVGYQKNFNMTEHALKVTVAEKEVSFFEVMSALTAAQSTKLDLVPREIKLKRRVREGSREIITLGSLIMTICLLISLILAVRIYFKSLLIEKLDTMNRTTFDDARVLERTSTKNRVVRKLLENRGKGLHVFDIVTALIGEDIYLSNFTYDSEGNLTVAGTAESMSRVFAFVTQLEESNYFSSVKTNETKSRREGKQDVADFEIKCILSEGV